MPAVAAHLVPDIAILDQKCSMLDLDVVRMHFINEGRLSLKQVDKVIYDAINILKNEPNLLKINTKCYIIGDIHGQYYDLLSILATFDLRKDTLLFLGDYVDRGSFSTEVYLYLLLLKSHYPNNIYLLRGNHESRKMTSYFTFRSECIYKYDDDIYEKFVYSFRYLPIAAVVQGKAFCCHGGMSPGLKNIDDLNEHIRFKEVEYKGVICDLMWSDPSPSYATGEAEWAPNTSRKCSYYYNYEAVSNFLKTNNLSIILRGHEVQQTGFLLYKAYKDMPSLITVFSAPNYCDTYKNNGAIVEFDEKVVSIMQFDAVSHPFVLRGFIDGINWSMPFIYEKLLEFASGLLQELNRVASNDYYDSTDTSEMKEVDSQSITEGNTVEKEEPPELKLASDLKETKIPVTIMRLQRESIDEFVDDEESTCDCSRLDVKITEVESFEEAKEKDATNEIVKEESTCSPPLSVPLSPSLQNLTIKDNPMPMAEDIQQSVKLKNNPIDINDEEANPPQSRRGWCLFKFCYND